MLFKLASTTEIKSTNIYYYFTSNNWNSMEIVLPMDAVNSQLQSTVGWTGEVRNPVAMFNQSLQIGLISLWSTLAENP